MLIERDGSCIELNETYFKHQTPKHMQTPRFMHLIQTLDRLQGLLVRWQDDLIPLFNRLCGFPVKPTQSVEILTTASIWLIDIAIMNTLKNSQQQRCCSYLSQGLLLTKGNG